MKTKQNNLEGFKDYVKAVMEDWKVPGTAIGIIKGNDVIFKEGFGYKDINNQQRVTPETIFAIGSATKAFTTTAMGLLADDGEMTWDEPLRNYMPEFKLYDGFASDKVTPRDIVCHRTGLPRHDLMWHGSSFTRKEIIERIQFLQPSKDFRSHMQYQNIMYAAAGYLIEKISGQTWEEFVAERIFKPLEMKNSNFSVRDTQKASDYAKPYADIEGEIKEVPFRNLDAMGPCGSINSSVLDMCNWIKLQLNSGKFDEKIIISEENTKQIHTPQMVIDKWGTVEFKELPYISYGLGWFIQPYRGYNMIHHGGNIDGFSALVSFMPEEKLGIVILTNMNVTLLPKIITYNLYDRLLGLDQIDWNDRLKTAYKKILGEKDDKNGRIKAKRKENTKPSHPIEDYIGEYEHPGYGKLGILYDKEKLHLKYNGRTIVFEHYHYDIFKMDYDTGDEVDTFLVSFITDREGNIARLYIPFEPTPGVEEMVFNKVSTT